MTDRTDYIAKTKLELYQSRILFDRRPVTADIFLTDFCNLTCPHCKYPKGQSYMHPENARRFFTRLKQLGVKGFVITGGGEPTLHPQFEYVLAIADELGVPYGINTNWVIPKKCNPVFLKVSIDAWDRDEYVRRKGADYFDRVIENIRRVREYAPDAVVGVQLIVSDVGQVIPFYEYFKDFEGIQYIAIRPYENPRAIYYENRQLAAILDELKAVRDRHGVYPHYKWKHLAKPLGMCCPANFAQLAIWPNGDVMYCCNKPWDIVGHILDEDIIRKKENCISDFKRCEIPCRLSGHNEYVDNYDTSILHPQFI